MESLKPLVKITKRRTPSKRLSFIERAQKESEELLRNMGGSFELEGGRRTRSSTRGTTSSSVAALTTPPPVKRSRRSPNAIVADVTPIRTPRGRGRKLEVKTSPVEVQESKNSPTLSSSNNNQTKDFLEAKVSDVLNTAKAEAENVDSDISTEQVEKQTASEETIRSIRDDEKTEKEDATIGMNQSKDTGVSETDNVEMDTSEDKPDAEMVSPPVKIVASDRVQDKENVGLTLEQSSEVETAEVKACEVPNETAASPKAIIAPKEIQKSSPDKTISDVGSSSTTASINTTTDITTTAINPTSAMCSVSDIKEAVKLSEDDIQKKDEQDSNQIMEIDADNNSSQLKAEESISIAADDANVANKLVKPSESKEKDSCKESTNSVEKSLQMDTISLDDSSIESEKQSMEVKVKQSSPKTVEEQSTATKSEKTLDKETTAISEERIADDAISLDYDTDNFSNKSENNANDLKIVDEIETDDGDDAISNDVKSINENKLLGAEEEPNDETVANGNSNKLSGDNKCFEGPSDAFISTSTTPTTTTA